MLRADGGVLNTHFRGFNAPMGLAIADDRLAIGTALEIWELHNVQVLPGRRYPDLLNDDRARIADSFVLPDEPLGAVPPAYVKRAGDLANR